MSLPRILVTGASGFLGRYLLREIAQDYEIFALARRSQSQAGVPEQPNIHWMQVDIGERDPLRSAFDWLKRQGGVEFLIHLAAYYDFTGEDHPEYQRTNIDGLRNVLELSENLGLRRFVFASSIAACSFPEVGGRVTEKSSPDANQVYARSKRSGEEMVRGMEWSFPCSVVRFAALYSDWCEYPPLFSFFSHWTSGGWNSRMLGGRGKFAIPYLHVRCGAVFISNLLRQVDTLGDGEIFLASPDGCIELKDIFSSIGLAFFGEKRKPLFVPKSMTAVWLRIQDSVGQVLGKRPFERPWMSRYLDRQLRIDASLTRERLRWTTRPRLDLIRRIPFLVENMRSQPLRWLKLNRAAIRKDLTGLSLKIDWLLERGREEIIRLHLQNLLAPENVGRFGSYGSLPEEDLTRLIRESVSQLRRSIRSREMEPFGRHCRKIAQLRMKNEFSVEEVGAAIEDMGECCCTVLEGEGDSERSEGLFRERIRIVVQFGIDEIRDEFELAGRCC